MAAGWLIIPRELTKIIPDSVLITRIKESADNSATLELITRHSGVYIDVINQYAFSPKIQVPELRDDKTFNLYSWALTYDPKKRLNSGATSVRRLDGCV